jgi:hypothetical protein
MAVCSSYTDDQTLVDDGGLRLLGRLAFLCQPHLGGRLQSQAGKQENWILIMHLTVQSRWFLQESRGAVWGWEWGHYGGPGKLLRFGTPQTDPDIKPQNKGFVTLPLKSNPRIWALL